jgi:hypothetical protein
MLPVTHMAGRVYSGSNDHWAEDVGGSPIVGILELSQLGCMDKSLHIDNGTVQCDVIPY